MTSLPFPSFVSTPQSSYRNLSSVGRCRIFPATLKSPVYADVLSKCLEHTQVASKEIDDPAEKKETKKVLKKLYKQSVGALSIYLTSNESPNLNLDPSIIDVEIALPLQDILSTDGLIATVFLDAGGSNIVLDLDLASNSLVEDSVSFLEALEMTRLPRSRLVTHFSNVGGACFDSSAILGYFSNALALVSTVSMSFQGDRSVLGLTLEEVFKWLDHVKKNDEIGDAKLVVQCSTGKDEEFDQMIERVGQISKECKGKVLVSLIDPTAKELGLSYAKCCRSDRPDGLYTTVVCTRNNEALGLVYSSKESIVATLQGTRAVYYSRSRKNLWRKGDTSGRHQTIHRIDVDCDGDALRFSVTQHGADCAAFCHLGTLTCWGDPCGMRKLEGTLKERVKNAPAGSYTKRLLDDDEFLRDKLVEEAQELSEAVDKDEVIGELADVIYFAMVKAAKAGVSIDDAASALDIKARKVTRRQGDSKAFRIAAGKAILEKKNGSKE